MSSDEMSALQAWFNWISGAIVLLISGVFNIYRGKVDKLEADQRSMVTREELQKSIERVLEDKRNHHLENLANFRQLHGDIERLHSRIDEIKR